MSVARPKSMDGLEMSQLKLREMMLGLISRRSGLIEGWLGDSISFAEGNEVPEQMDVEL